MPMSYVDNQQKIFPILKMLDVMIIREINVLYSYN